MLKYLDTKYPNAFIQRTKFGLCPYYDGEILNGHLIKMELKYWFGINDIESGELLDAWYGIIPHVTNLVNSTNPHVLAMRRTECNNTVYL